MARKHSPPLAAATSRSRIALYALLAVVAVATAALATWAGAHTGSTWRGLLVWLAGLALTLLLAWLAGRRR